MKLTKTILCLILSAALLCALGGFALASEAPAEEAVVPAEPVDEAPALDGAEPYPVWVAGVQVTSANRSNVLGDGTVSFDPSTVTLTFSDTDSYQWPHGSYQSALVYASHVDLTLRGSGMLLGGDLNNAVFVEGGSLTINGDLNMASRTNVVYVPDGNVVISGGSLNLTSQGPDGKGLLCYGDVSITGGDVYAYGAYHGLYVTNLFMNGGVLDATGSQREGVHAGTDIVLSGGDIFATGGSWALFAYGDIEIGNSVRKLYVSGGDCGILADESLTIGSMLELTDPEGGRLSQDGRYVVEADGMTKAAHVGLTQRTETPTVKIAPDGGTAAAAGFDGLYARVALVIDNGGVSGLYVTQAPINTDGTIVVPSFMIPGLTVKGVNIALVPSLADITSAQPAALASDFKML